MTGASVLRALLAAVFALAAAGKMTAGVQRFADILGRYQVLPIGSEKRVAMAIIGCEAAAALLILTPWYRLGAALAAVVAAGAAYLVSTALAHGHTFSCGCFGRVMRLSVSPWLLAADICLFAALLTILTEGTGTLWQGRPWHQLAAFTSAALVLGGAAQATRVAFFSYLDTEAREATRVPRLTLRTVSGPPISVRELAAQGGVVLFVEASCTSCIRLVQILPTLELRDLPVLVVSSREHTPEVFAARIGCDPRWTTGGTEGAALRRRLRVRSVPTAVVLGDERILAAVFPASGTSLEQAAARVAGQPRRAPHR
jgi:hypothetical protein